MVCRYGRLSDALDFSPVREVSCWNPVFGSDDSRVLERIEILKKSSFTATLKIDKGQPDKVVVLG